MALVSYSMAPNTKALTLAAVGFLGLDGVLFLWLAYAIGRPGLVWAGVAAFVLAAAVLLASRAQQRRLEMIAREREALRLAAEEMRGLARRGEGR